LRTSNNANADTSAIPDEDTSEVSALFEERLQAWKHAVAYLEDYISATERMHHSNAKEYEKVGKTVSSPLKEGDHFEGNPGGVVEMFENFKTTTQVMFWRERYCASTGSHQRDRPLETITPKLQRPSKAVFFQCSSAYTLKSRRRARSSARVSERQARR